MKTLVFGIVLLLPLVSADNLWSNFSLSQDSATRTDASSIGTSLLDVIANQTARFRSVYNHQLELFKTNKTRNNILVKFKDTTQEKDEEELEDSNLNPFFKWVKKLKQSKYEKIKKLKGQGLEKMFAKMQSWNITGIHQKFYGTQTGLNILQIDDAVNMESIWTTILNDADVEFAELDMEMALFNDCDLVSDWGYRHTRADYAMDLLGLSDQPRDNESTVLVAVIDSGVDYQHSLLRDRIWVNENEMNGIDGVDDDNNGYVDDKWGWNFAVNSNDVLDVDGHGTHVAGIIAGMPTSNPDEFSGVAPNVMILPCRFTDTTDSGTVSAAIQCMEYAFEMGADILSNSWGGIGADSLALEEAMNRASREGILQVIAAGNAATDNDKSREQAVYPASYETDIIIAVAAIGGEGELTSISNYGASSVDIGAPGHRILSIEREGSFQRMSGTSQATPYVAAAAAVLLGACRQQRRICTAVEIKEAILEGAQPSEQLRGRVRSSGFLDIPNAARILGLTNSTSVENRNTDDFDICRGSSLFLTRPNLLLVLIILSLYLILQV